MGLEMRMEMDMLTDEPKWVHPTREMSEIDQAIQYRHERDKLKLRFGFDELNRKVMYGPCTSDDYDRFDQMYLSFTAFCELLDNAVAKGVTYSEYLREFVNFRIISGD